MKPDPIKIMARAIHSGKHGLWYEGPLKQTDSQRECLADAQSALSALYKAGFVVVPKGCATHGNNCGWRHGHDCDCGLESAQVPHDKA